MSWGIYRTKRCIPKKVTRCPMLECVYNGERAPKGYCDDPRINHGNGDALCHRWKAGKVIDVLAQSGNQKETT